MAVGCRLWSRRFLFQNFNPILQGEKFDKEGEYVKRWVKELKHVPKKFIHKPWELNDRSILNLGLDYPVLLLSMKKQDKKHFKLLKKFNFKHYRDKT